MGDVLDTPVVYVPIKDRDEAERVRKATEHILGRPLPSGKDLEDLRAKRLREYRDRKHHTA